MPAGPIGSRAPSRARPRRHRARRSRCCARSGPYDVGQAAVVADNHVLAVEAAEGTDGMLARVAELRARGRIPTPAGRGVLVKAPKPDQDRRIDLPTIGPRTVAEAARAGPRRHRGRGRAKPSSPSRHAVAARGRRGEDLRARHCRRARHDARAAAAAASRRGGRVRRCARRRADGARCARLHRGVAFARRRRARDGEPKASSARSTSPTCRSSASRRSRASFRLILRRIRADRRRGDRGAAGRAGHHRQPGLHPPGRAPRAQGGAGHSDHQLCAADASGPGGRGGRARCARYVDEVLAILPFEPAAFARLDGPRCSYVGHPLAERDRRRCGRAPRRRGGALADPPLVLVLPGSRRGEIQRFAATFGAAIAQAAATAGPFELVLPTLPHVARARPRGDRRLAGAPAHRGRGGREARGVPQRARGARQVRHGHAGARARAGADRRGLSDRRRGRRRSIGRLVRVSSVILANLVIGENVVPELLQEEFTAGADRRQA